jgi:hypothetical protein
MIPKIDLLKEFREVHKKAGLGYAEMCLAINVGNMVIDELKNKGYKVPKLNSSNKKLFEKYKKFIWNFETKGLDKDLIEKCKEDLEEEEFYVEMFLGWLQKNKYVIEKKIRLKNES